MLYNMKYEDSYLSFNCCLDLTMWYFTAAKRLSEFACVSIVQTPKGKNWNKPKGLKVAKEDQRLLGLMVDRIDGW